MEFRGIVASATRLLWCWWQRSWGQSDHMCFSSKENVWHHSQNLSFFSDWWRLLRFVAFLKRAVRDFRRSSQNGSVQLDGVRNSYVCVKDIDDAELIVIQWIQQLAFPDDIDKLESNERSSLPKAEDWHLLIPSWWMAFSELVDILGMHQFQRISVILPFCLKVPLFLLCWYRIFMKRLVTVEGNRFFHAFERSFGLLVVTLSLVVFSNHVCFVGATLAVPSYRKWLTCLRIVWSQINPP